MKENAIMNRKKQILETIEHIFEISTPPGEEYGRGSDPKRVEKLAKMIGHLLKGKEKRTEEAVAKRMQRGKRGNFPKFKT